MTDRSLYALSFTLSDHRYLAEFQASPAEVDALQRHVAAAQTHSTGLPTFDLQPLPDTLTRPTGATRLLHDLTEIQLNVPLRDVGDALLMRAVALDAPDAMAERTHLVLQGRWAFADTDYALPFLGPMLAVPVAREAEARAFLQDVAHWLEQAGWVDEVAVQDVSDVSDVATFLDTVLVQGLNEPLANLPKVVTLAQESDAHLRAALAAGQTPSYYAVEAQLDLGGESEPVAWVLMGAPTAGDTMKALGRQLKAALTTLVPLESFSLERLSNGHEWGPTTTPAPALARVAQLVRQNASPEEAQAVAQVLEQAFPTPTVPRRRRPR